MIRAKDSYQVLSTEDFQSLDLSSEEHELITRINFIVFYLILTRIYFDYFIL
jgi:hypothetical protein